MIHNEKQAFSTLVAMQNEFCRQFLFIPYYNGFNQQYIFIKHFKMHGIEEKLCKIAIILLFLAGCSTDVKESDIKFAGETGVKVSLVQ